LQRVLEEYRAQPVESLNGTNGHRKPAPISFQPVQRQPQPQLL
jgi:hypothetical protein